MTINDLIEYHAGKAKYHREEMIRLYKHRVTARRSNKELFYDLYSRNKSKYRKHMAFIELLVNIRGDENEL